MKEMKERRGEICRFDPVGRPSPSTTRDARANSSRPYFLGLRSFFVCVCAPLLLPYESSLSLTSHRDRWEPSRSWWTAGLDPVTQERRTVSRCISHSKCTTEGIKKRSPESPERGELDCTHQIFKALPAWSAALFSFLFLFIIIIMISSREKKKRREGNYDYC